MSQRVTGPVSRKREAKSRQIAFHPSFGFVVSYCIDISAYVMRLIAKDGKSVVHFDEGTWKERTTDGRDAGNPSQSREATVIDTILSFFQQPN